MWQRNPKCPCFFTALLIASVDPQGSKYRYSIYMGPKVMILEPLKGLGINHIPTWTQWLRIPHARPLQNSQRPARTDTGTQNEIEKRLQEQNHLVG